MGVSPRIILTSARLANCAKPDTHCVSFRDLIDWMNIQDPAVLAQLQQQAPELGPVS